jgi:hypothetical protein
MFSLIKCRNVLSKDGDQTATLLEELTDGTKALFELDHRAIEYLLDGKTFG